MTKHIFRILQYLSIVFLGISLVAGCAQSIKPFDNNSLGQITFSFADNDNDEGEIGGDITLDIPAQLIPAELAEFVIYWGTTPAFEGKDALLQAVAVADFKANTPVLYTIPENTAIAQKYFLLFLKGKDGKEIYSGKASLAADKYEGVQVPEVTDVTQEPPAVETPQAEVQSAATPAASTPDASAASTEQPQAMAEQGPQVQSDSMVVVPIKNVLFEFDKSYLREDFKENLNKDLGNIPNKEQKKLLIAGHADERGSNEYNLALGERRAFAVKRYLISMGFLAENIRIISYGEEKPVDTGHNEEAWTKNRRAESEVQE